MKTLKNKLILGICLMFILPDIYAQSGVSINFTGAGADTSSILDVSATNRGVLIPRIALTDTSDITTIPGPAHSLIIFNTSTGGGLTEGYYYNDGTATDPHWVELIPNPMNQNFNMAGNKIINLATCTDDHDAANKAYVDAVAGGGGGGTGGSGLFNFTEITTYINSGATMSWATCADSCINSTYNGETDWRMPTAAEVLYYRSSFNPVDAWTGEVWTLGPPEHASGSGLYSLLYVNENNGSGGSTYYNGWGNKRCRCVR